MSITQTEIDWLEENYLYIRTWVLENTLTNTARPQLPVAALSSVPTHIETFLLRYYPAIHDWILNLESREIAADSPAISFEEFLGTFDAQNREY